MRRIAFIALSAVALLIATPYAQSPAGSPPAQATPVGPFDRLPFRNIGPATPSGRIDDFAVYEKDPAIFYVGAATGGVWKTTNHGTTLEPVFEHETTSSIGDIAIAPTDPNLVWVGTGENNNRQSSSWGDGLYKSSDGGRTWTNMGLRDSRHIARVIVDPVDFNTVYVAALGNLWGPGGERGVYKTTDGGTTWTRVLHVDDDTGATELVMDPGNRSVLYAATYQRRRQGWGMNGGGPGSAIWKTTDAGRTWTKLTKGVPEGPKGRIGLDIYRRDPNVLYARIEHEKESGVYRSDDAGASWTKMSATNPRPMYFSQIRIDPGDDHRIYVLGVQLHVSDDGGKTFRADGARNIHVDHHAMWIDPFNSKHLMTGNDGGVSISYDRAKTWVWLPNLPVGQLYHVSYDMQTPYHVCGGLQDNNTWCGPSARRTASGIANDDWYVISGGDGFQALMDPADPRTVYGESQDGRMSRTDRVTNERTSLRPEPADGDKPYRWNWDTAMMLSPHDPKTIFVGANRLFRSRDRGHSWEVISPDLTTNTDRDALSIMGVTGKDTTIAKHDGVTSYGNLVTIAESPMKAGIYFTGSDDGVVSVSRDAGASWKRITPSGLPKGAYVSKVAPSRFDAGTVYATFDNHRNGDFGTYTYVSSDFGATWKSLNGDLPKGQVVRTVTEDLKNRDVLYLGTEAGLWVSTTRGQKWTKVAGTFPTVPVYEITLHPRDNAMILATHGRVVWILDDLTPFQQFAKAQATDAFVFDARPAVTWNPANDRMKNFEGDRQFLGQNPAAGLPLSYYLEAAAKNVKLTIRAGAGAVVRELTGDAVKDRNQAGINTVVWDLREAPLAPMRNQPAGGGGGGFFGNQNNGPHVLPGAYTITLVVDGKDAQTVRIAVAGDPAIPVSDADRRQMHDTAMALMAGQRQANEAADTVADAWKTLAAIQDTTKGKTIDGGLRGRLDATVKQATDLRRRLGLVPADDDGQGPGPNVRSRVGQLKSQVMGSTAKPTETQLRIAGELATLVDKVVADTNAFVATLPALYKDLANAGVYPAAPAAVK